MVLHKWFSPGTPVSSTNKTDRHDITEILLKVALNSIINSNHKFDSINMSTVRQMLEWSWIGIETIKYVFVTVARVKDWSEFENVFVFNQLLINN